MKRTFTTFFFLLFLIMLNAQDLTNGLVGYYSFDGNANDGSSNGYNGTATDITYVADHNGEAGKAASFNGSSSKIVTALHQKGLTEYTISVWVKVPPSAGTKIIVCHKGVSGQGDGIAITDKSFGLDGDYALRFIEKKTALPTDTWYHITGVWKGSAGTSIDQSQMKLYINGVLADDINILSAIDTRAVPFDEDTAMVIGRHTAWNQWFNGSIDELRIYNRALSAKEIKLLYSGTGIYLDFAEKELISDSTYILKWIGEEEVAADILYSADNGKTWNNIVSNLTDSIYNWTVPSIETDSLKIRVANHNLPSQYNETDLLRVFNTAVRLNLEAWYTFDSNADDHSGNGHHAVVSGASVVEINNSDKAFRFDGINDYIMVPELNPMQQFSITGWFKTSDSTGALSSLWGAGYISVNNYENTAPGKLCLNLENPNATYSIIEDTAVTSDNEWHFCAVTVSDEKIKLYVDKRLAGIESVNGSIDYNYNNWYLGHYDYGTSLKFKGILDDVRFYKAAIDSQVVSELYTSRLCEYKAPLVNAGNDRTVCSGNQVTLNAAGTAESYTWNNGATNGVPFVITESSTFVVTGILNGCEAKDTISITANICTSLDNIFEEKISIYPNPSAGDVYIKANSPIKTMDIRIYNLQGSLIQTILNVKNEAKISGLNKGIYMVKINTNKGTIIYKQIIN